MENQNEWMTRALELESQQDYLKKQVELLSQSNFNKVQAFHAVFNKEPDPMRPTVPSQDEVELRLRLIVEEFEEVMAVMGYPVCELIFIEDMPEGSSDEYSKEISLPKLAKELADLLVVVYGTAAKFGINIDDVFDAVHSSNMTKVDKNGRPVYRADGKIMKTELYVEPDIQGVLDQQGE